MVVISSWSPSNELLKLNRRPKTRRNKKETSHWISFHWSSWELSCVKLVGMVTDRQVINVRLNSLLWFWPSVSNFSSWSPSNGLLQLWAWSTWDDGHPNSKQEKWQIIKYPLVTISSWKSLMCEACNMKEANSKWWQTFVTIVWLFLFLAGDGRRFKLITADEASNSGVTNLQMVTPTQN